MSRAKLLRTANREIFVSGEAYGAGILDLYSEHSGTKRSCLRLPYPSLARPKKKQLFYVFPCGPHLTVLRRPGILFASPVKAREMPKISRELSGTERMAG